MGASYLDEDRLRRSIAAIATATGRGAIGIVRVSGRDAIQIAARVFSRPGRLTAADSHTMTLGKIRHPDGSTIDEVIAAVMRAPNSYTGDDSVEFQCHGGHVPTNGVLQACLEAGALAALPGEFTFRGFINGRIDLTQAEAVADLINSSTASAARTALEHSDGVLRKELELRDVRVPSSFWEVVLVELRAELSHAVLAVLTHKPGGKSRINSLVKCGRAVRA